jgi:ribokinase
MKVLNFGSLNYDYVYSVNHIVNAGETISSSKMETFCGGKGLNQSVALARSGEKVYHAGLVGFDGLLLLDTCQENNVDISYIKKVEGKSGHTIIQVDEKGQNSIILYGGSNRSLTKEYVDNVLSHFTAGDWILLQNEINLLKYIMDSAYERGLNIALNPSPFDKVIQECDLSKVSLFLLNEIEGEQITKSHQSKDILDFLLDKYENARVILTLGSEGVIYRDKTVESFKAAYKVKAIDTTAAGDTFTGYFMHAVLHDYPIKEALELATKASAIAVSRAGATVSIPYMDEVKAF